MTPATRPAAPDRRVYDTLGDFAHERSPYFDVRVAPAARGGWDVVLRIDGSYPSRADALHMARYFADEVELTRRAAG